MIVTRDRPALLEQCLAAVLGQRPPPDSVIVVDNASGSETRDLLARYTGVHVHRLLRNSGGAGGFRAGIEVALECGADWLWLMDDDGRPKDPTCLGSLLRTAHVFRADLIGAVVIDADEPDRLSFPIRLSGRTRFKLADVLAHGAVQGFAHLFNGALISAELFRRIGLPEARFFIRGDEVEFLYRARRSNARIVLDPNALVLHPSTRDELYPILGGLFYATLPEHRSKQHYQFRNRAYIFRCYSMWGWLTADILRYTYFFLVCRRLDVAGLKRWAASTRTGLRGTFMRLRKVDRLDSHQPK